MTISLSDAAVAVLRFEIRGVFARAKPHRLPAYRELVAAGILESVPGTERAFRLMPAGEDRRREILSAVEAELDRLEPPVLENVELSAGADLLLRFGLAGERVDVTEETRPLYRELAAAGMMIPLHTFARGKESAFRLTKA